MQINIWPWSHTCWGNSNWSSSMQMSSNLHFQVILQVDHRWPLTLICDLLTIWTYEVSNIISINQVWFKSDFKWGHFHIFSISYNLTSDDLWPWHMTFDCMTIWRFPYYINKSSLVPIRLQLLKWGQLSHFQPILQFDLRWPLTLICDLWPHQKMRVSMLHLWPNFGWNPSKHVKSRAKC